MNKCFYIASKNGYFVQQGVQMDDSVIIPWFSKSKGYNLRIWYMDDCGNLTKEEWQETKQYRKGLL